MHEYETLEIKSNILRYKYGLFEAYLNGLAVDDVGDFLYWIHQHKTLEQSSLKGSNTMTLLQTGKLRVTCKQIH